MNPPPKRNKTLESAQSLSYTVRPKVSDRKVGGLNESYLTVPKFNVTNRQVTLG